jgi:hypothetical protein
VSTAIFLRLLRDEDKAQTLAETIAALREGRRLESMTYPVLPTSFRQVPGSPFAYWVSERTRRLFTELPSFEGGGRTAKRGPSTGDDSRRVRAWWEVNPAMIGRSKRWVPFSKGGSYSSYYADIHLLVAWDESRRTFLDFWGRPGRMIERPEALDFFFRPGITWPLRTNGLSFRSLPAGCVFGHKGPAAFVSDDDDISLLALAPVMNSRAFYLLVQMLVARISLAQSFEVGLIQAIPVPNLSGPDKTRLGQLASSCLEAKRNLDRSNETSHIFHLPALRLGIGNSLVERTAAWHACVSETEQLQAGHQREIDNIVFRLYGINGEDRLAIEESLSEPLSKADSEEFATDSADEEAEAEPTADARQLVADLLSYAVGCVFGRWNVRFATGERQPPELPNPFAPLPVCSPGMLTGEDGLPLREAPSGYPFRIDQDGILVDDPDHPDDIIRRAREVLEVLWQDNADAIEREACDVLDVRELRDYFRRSGKGGFWDNHVSRYSKSRRKAPIYWLLQSSKKNYALWIYNQWLDKDMLFKALLNYVEPKIRLEESRLEPLRAQLTAAGTSGKGVKKLEKEIDRREEFISELRDFEDKLRRVANLHLEPDLNDGVVLNIAPLWELVPWKESKKYWEELRDGDYEWSSIGKQLRQKGIAQSP